MDLWSAIFTVVRRWYISVPVVVVSVVTMLVIGTRMKPDYQSKASVVFNPPARTVINGQDQAFKNQWASDPKTLAAAVYRQLKSTDEQKRLKDQNYSTRYEIALDQFSALMDIAATGKSQDEAINTASQLIKEAEQTAKNIQKQSQPPANEYVTVNTVSQPVDAELVPGSKTRVMATILLLGLVGAASAAFMAESLANRRRLMREGGGVPPVPPLPQHYPYPPYSAAPYSAAPYPALPPGGYVSAGPAPPGYGYTPVMPMASPADDVDPDLVTVRAGAQPSPQPSPRNLSRRAESDERALDSLLDEVAVEEQEPASRPARGSDAHVINRGRGARAEQSAVSAAGRSRAPAGEEDALEITEPAAPAADGDEPAEVDEQAEVDEHAELDEHEHTEVDEHAEVDEFDESQGLVEAPGHVAATEQSLLADAPRSSAASADVAEGFEALGDIDDEARVSYAGAEDADRGGAANEVVVLGPATTAGAATAPAAQTDVAPDADDTPDTDLPDTDLAEEGPSIDSAESATPAVGEVAEPSTPEEPLEPSGQGQAASRGARGRGTDGSGRSAERRREADRNKAGRNNGGRDGADRKPTTRNGGNSRSSARRARRSLFSPPTGGGSADAGDDVVPPVTSDTPTPHGD